MKTEQIQIGGKNLPEKKFRAGAIAATVWKNQGQGKDGIVNYSTISLERGYKDKNGAWKSTTSFRINDLPRAALVLEEAYRFLVLKEQGSAADSSYISEEEIIY